MANKVGRPRSKRPHQIAYILPYDVDVNLAKRAYWYLLELEKRMAKDITSVRAKDYFEACEKYAEYSTRLKKAGKKVNRHGKVTIEQGVEPLGLAADGLKVEPGTPGGDEQIGVGAGIPADDPFA